MIEQPQLSSSPPDRKQYTCRVIRLQLEAEEGNDRGRPLLTSRFQQIMRGFTLPSQFPPLSTNQNLIQDSSEEIGTLVPCCLSRAVTVMLGWWVFVFGGGCVQFRILGYIEYRAQFAVRCYRALQPSFHPPHPHHPETEHPLKNCVATCMLVGSQLRKVPCDPARLSYRSKTFLGPVLSLGTIKYLHLWYSRDRLRGFLKGDPPPPISCASTYSKVFIHVWGFVISPIPYVQGM